MADEDVLWKVIGGAKSGGVMVRYGMDKDSPQVKEAGGRISTGATLKQIKLSGERLQYKKVDGDGPETGWVSIKLKDAVLVEKLVKDAVVNAACPCIKDGFLEFPKEFVFGVATAAFQIEGAGKKYGRAPCIWDEYCEKGDKIKHEGATGDVACDHYHRFKDDIKIMKTMGVKHYRFSVSWCRLIPGGEGAVNQQAVDFYNNLINELKAQGIEPWCTLYHWDLPIALHRAPFWGWLGKKEDVTKAFGHFAHTCFRLFGDRVKKWMTLNEPHCCANLGYGAGGKFAPGFQADHPSLKEGAQEYMCMHNMLLSHAEAVKIYRENFKATQKGEIGIAFNAQWKRPKDMGSSEDISAANRCMEFELGWSCGPIYKGDYPQVVKDKVKDRLPQFTFDEKKLLKDSCDFFGINNYFSGLAQNLAMARQQGWRHEHRGIDEDQEAYALQDASLAQTDFNWGVCPWGFRDLLLHIQEKFSPKGGIFVTENGCAYERDESAEYDSVPENLVPKEWDAENPPAEDFENETYEDPMRVKFFKAHLAAVHAAKAKGADVRGFFAWSFLDNFEWEEGYTKRFGIVRVDYPTQKRTIKRSGRFFSEVIKKGGFEAMPKEEQWQGNFW